MRTAKRPPCFFFNLEMTEIMLPAVIGELAGFRYMGHTYVTWDWCGKSFAVLNGFN